MNFGAPIFLLNMLYYLHQHHQPLEHLDCVEYYSGAGVIAQSFVEQGLLSRTFDVLDKPTQEDATTPEGFLNSMFLSMSLKSLDAGGSLGHWGTVCSTWVFMSRSSTGRSAERPEGFANSECVAIGNCQVARMALILAYFIATLRHWILLSEPLTRPH